MEGQTSRRNLRLLGVILAVAFVVVALVCFFAGSSQNSNPPAFIPLHLPATNSYMWESYNAYDLNPSRDGKLWVSARLGTRDFQSYLYDLRSRTIIGQTTNCGPLFFNGDQTKLLCQSWAEDTSLSGRLVEQVSTFLSKIRVLHYKPNRPEQFFVLDVRDNSIKRLGGFSQLAGCGSRWVASPTFRYAVNIPSSEWGKSHGYICDLETAEFKKFHCPGEPHGWWDSESVLFVSRDIVLYNVVTGNTSNLFTQAEIKSFLKQNDLPDCQLTSFSKLNGTTVDNYFAPEKEHSWGKGFLLKAHHATRTLKIIDRNFQFHWLGYLDPTDRFYVYPGEPTQPGRGGDGSVQLRNLRDNSARTLVAPDKSGYAIARFFDDGILYTRRGHIWRVDLNGSNNVPLFGATNVVSVAR